jgi:hypothetical protein
MAPRSARFKLLLLFGIIVVVAAYWSIPIPGQVLLVPDNWRQVNAWPQVRISTEDLQSGQEASLVIFDTVPWPHVKLIVEDGEGTLNGYEVNDTTGVYRWNWSFTIPDSPRYGLKFYHDCDTGCQAWTTVAAGEATAPENAAASPELIPTKLGVVFANPARNWHNRRGWVVELTYAQLAEAEYWGIDDLARRVEAATNKGLLVLVRVDYDQGQSIPPPDDHLALDAYLNTIRRLARDDRLEGVYGYIIGSGFNTRGSNSQASENMVTPAWYARVFNGYSVPADHTDNVVQTIRAENRTVRVLVGPVAPWRSDQDGALTYRIDVPWLNYFNTLAAAIDQAAQEKTAAGIALVAPDGFAVQAPGRPDAPELTDSERADEPRIDLQRQAWDSAQAGFRIYRNWLDIINAYPHTEGLPVYISSTNTFQPDTGIAPAQNYPLGWLTTALEIVNQEPQIAALCWFLDVFPHDDQWDFFSLTEPRGRMVNAADEFDSLLQNTSR